MSFVTPFLVEERLNTKNTVGGQGSMGRQQPKFLPMTPCTPCCTRLQAPFSLIQVYLITELRWSSSPFQYHYEWYLGRSLTIIVVVFILWFSLLKKKVTKIFQATFPPIYRQANFVLQRPKLRVQQILCFHVKIDYDGFSWFFSGLAMVKQGDYLSMRRNCLLRACPVAGNFRFTSLLNHEGTIRRLT